MKTRLLTVLTVLVAAFCLCPHARAAAVDYFLKIDDIEGGSPAPGHSGEIEVLSFSWGVSNTVTRGAPTGGGKVSVNDFSILKQVDKATPKLFLACVTGKLISKATLVCITPSTMGGTGFANPPGEFYTIKLSDVLISSVQTTGATDEDPMAAVTETLSMSFAKIEWTYKNADGTTVQGSHIVKPRK